MAEFQCEHLEQHVRAQNSVTSKPQSTLDDCKPSFTPDTNHSWPAAGMEAQQRSTTNKGHSFDHQCRHCSCLREEMTRARTTQGIASCSNCEQRTSRNTYNRDRCQPDL